MDIESMLDNPSYANGIFCAPGGELHIAAVKRGWRGGWMIGSDAFFVAPSQDFDRIQEEALQDLMEQDIFA